jgi:hypothetical protein
LGLFKEESPHKFALQAVITLLSWFWQHPFKKMIASNEITIHHSRLSLTTPSFSKFHWEKSMTPWRATGGDVSLDVSLQDAKNKQANKK